MLPGRPKPECPMHAPAGRTGGCWPAGPDIPADLGWPAGPRLQACPYARAGVHMLPLKTTKLQHASSPQAHPAVPYGGR